MFNMGTLTVANSCRYPTLPLSFTKQHYLPLSFNREPHDAYLLRSWHICGLDDDGNGGGVGEAGGGGGVSAAVAVLAERRIRAH